jgi:NAD(P)-dependent dehydrogenase (short-subunit alcohol dehydrogenase family)
MERKTCVVTGATGGIGKWVALGMAQAGYKVVLVGRDRARGEAAKSWIAERVPDAVLDLMLADLSSIAATRALGQQIASRHPRLAVLINNAGVFRARREQTAEGHEMVLAVNYLSPFVLMQELEAALRAGAPSRIVTVGSSTSDRASIQLQNLELGRGWNMVRAYGQSKLAVMMTTFEWARRLRASGVTANVVHPGMVATGLIRTPGIIGLSWRLIALFSRSEQQGAETPLYAALSPELDGKTGKYLKDRMIVPPNRLAEDAALANQLWQETARLLVNAATARPPAMQRR